jgi:hypothetical protein
MMMMVSRSTTSLPFRFVGSLEGDGLRELTFGTRILLQLFLEQADPSGPSGDHAGEIRSLSRSSGGRHWAKRRSESQGRRKELVTVGL